MTVEKPNNEQQMIEMRETIIKTIADDRVGVDQGTKLDNYASFSLNVSKLTYTEVMGVVNKVREKGFGYERYEAGQQSLLVTKRLVKSAEIEMQSEAPLQLQYKVSIPENNGYRTQLNRLDRVLEHIRQFDLAVTLDASANDPDNIILKVDASKAFKVKGILETHYGFKVEV